MAKVRKRAKWDSHDIQLVCMAGLGVVFLAVFAYVPMGGILLAFKEGNNKINLFRALFEADWTLSNFQNLFSDPG